MQGDDETLREALFELKVLREREAEALRESNALLKGLSSITDAARPAEALTRLLRSIEGSLGCDLVALIAGAHGAAEIREATDSTLAGLSFPAAPLRLRRPIRAADAATLTWWPAMPAPLQRFSALLIVPISLPDGEAGAILCLTGEHAGFSPDDQNLLSRLAILAAQALATLSLSERNALLAGVIAGSSASVVVADARSPETPLVYVNDAFVALSGYARAEVLGRNCRFLSAEEADSPERLRLRHCVATRSNGTFELRNRKRDGSFFWNRLTLFAVGEPGEPPRYLVATQVDITAERAAADERDLAQRRLTAALSATSEGFLLLDPHGTIVLANARYRTFFEADAAPFLPGVRFAEAWRARLLAIGYPEADAAEGARHRQDRLFGGEQNREETLPDGRVLQVSDRATSDGGAVSIATDITARVATERILAQRAAAMDATEDGIAVTDEAGRFTYMNPSHLAMFGYEREGEVLGRHWTTLYDAEKAEYLTRVGMPEIRRSGAWRTEITGRSRSGAEVEQEVSLSYLPGIGLVCVSRDISERRQNERERARLRDQLQSAQRQEAIGQLAAGVAHDFNNLLSVITTSTSLAEGDLEEGREVQSHLQRVQAAARNASRLVRRLLHLGGRPSEIRAVDLGAAMGEAADLLRAG
ncbi:MAG: PAS domain S-box protein, partial [Pseudomonadota bacterium]